MCMAAATTVVQARELVGLGEIDPETVVTPASLSIAWSPCPGR